MRSEITVRLSTFRLLLLTCLFGTAALSAIASTDFCSDKVLEAVRKGDALGCGEFYLNRYQTLVGAVTALVAALIGLVAINRQVEQSRISEALRLEREGAAARAVLALALSEVCDFAQGCIEALRDHRPESQSPIDWPEFPRDVIEAFQACIRTAGVGRRQVSELLQRIQIFRSRLRGDRFGSATLQDRLYDALDLYTRASAIFADARADYDPTPADRDGIRRTARLMHVDVGRHFILARRLGVPPEEEDDPV